MTGSARGSTRFGRRGVATQPAPPQAVPAGPVDPPKAAAGAVSRMSRDWFGIALQSVIAAALIWGAGGVPPIAAATGLPAVVVPLAIVVATGAILAVLPPSSLRRSGSDGDGGSADDCDGGGD
jgi:hypothetical protein